MKNSYQNERVWTKGSIIALCFALFLFLANFGQALVSYSLPTDGWDVSDSATTGPSVLKFARYYLDTPTPIQVGDQLLAINGQPVEQIREAHHDFLRLNAPDWSDGTQLRYDILRNGQPLSVVGTAQVISIWQYLGLYKYAFNAQGVTQIAASLFFFFVSILVFGLRPGSRAAHALLFIGVTFFFLSVPGNFSPPTWFYPTPPASIPFDSWTLAINPSLMYLVLVFPRPKKVVVRYPILIALLFLIWPIAFNTAYLFNLYDREAYLKAAFTIYPIQIVLLMLITIFALVHSLITVRDAVGRSQLKWMFMGIFSFVFLGVGGWMVSTYLFPNTMGQGNWLTTVIGWFLLPACLAIGILRYRLFDIDVIIRKTLVYGALTATLGLVFFGGVTLLQQVFSQISGTENSPIAIVLSTLAIAALFSPLRGRMQDFIDRRFFRKKYNAEQALAEFAAAARSETNIEQLSTELQAVVRETVQPEMVNLWLKPGGGKR